MAKVSEFYLELTEAGIPAEDARFVMPNAAASSMVASLNLRELFTLRIFVYVLVLSMKSVVLLKVCVMR